MGMKTSQNGGTWGDELGRLVSSLQNHQDKRAKHLRDHDFQQVAIDMMLQPFGDIGDVVNAVRGRHGLPRMRQPTISTPMPGARSQTISQPSGVKEDPFGLRSGHKVSIQELQKKYPMLKQMNDQQLADAFHSRYYAEMPWASYYSGIGFQPGRPIPKSQQKPVAPVPPTGRTFVGDAVDAYKSGMKALFNEGDIYPTGVLNSVNQLQAAGELMGGFVHAIGGAVGRGQTQAGYRPIEDHHTVRRNGKFYYTYDDDPTQEYPLLNQRGKQMTDADVMAHIPADHSQFTHRMNRQKAWERNQTDSENVLNGLMLVSPGADVVDLVGLGSKAAQMDRAFAVTSAASKIGRRAVVARSGSIVANSQLLNELGISAGLGVAEPVLAGGVARLAAGSPITGWPARLDFAKTISTSGKARDVVASQYGSKGAAGISRAVASVAKKKKQVRSCNLW